MGWGPAQSLRGRGSHVQMRIQPEIERNPASGQAISASELFDLTGGAWTGRSTLGLSGLDAHPRLNQRRSRAAS